MKKLLLIALLAAVASAASMPTMGKVLGFGTAAYAGNGQGDNNDADGDDFQEGGNTQ